MNVLKINSIDKLQVLRKKSSKKSFAMVFLEEYHGKNSDIRNAKKLFEKNQKTLF